MVTVDGTEINYEGLPEQHRDTVRRYMEAGLDPGYGFSRILSGNLDAVIVCDGDTVAELPKIYRWLHNHAPSQAWGSEERMNAWMRARRTA